MAPSGEKNSFYLTDVEIKSWKDREGKFPGKRNNIYMVSLRIGKKGMLMAC